MKRSPREILKFRAEPVLRRAIKLRAAYDDVDLQDVIVDILRKGLHAEIEEVRRLGLVESTPEANQTSKRGRKRKEPEQDG